MSVDSVLATMQSANQASIQIALIKNLNEQQAQVMDLLSSLTGTIVNTSA